MNIMENSPVLCAYGLDRWDGELLNFTRLGFGAIWSTHKQCMSLPLYTVAGCDVQSQLSAFKVHWNPPLSHPLSPP